jgi:hypothetical protein
MKKERRKRKWRKIMEIKRDKYFITNIFEVDGIKDINDVADWVIKKKESVKSEEKDLQINYLKLADLHTKPQKCDIVLGPDTDKTKLEEEIRKNETDVVYIVSKIFALKLDLRSNEATLVFKYENEGKIKNIEKKMELV